MSIIYFQEDERITPSKMKRKLELTNVDSIDNLLNQLKLAKVLRHFIPKIEIDNLIEEQLEETIDNNEYFYFRYVGLLLIQDIIIIVYPKYIKNISNDFLGDKLKFKQILMVIQKFQSLHVNNDIEEEEGNFLTLQFYLQKSFVENGLYSNDISSIEVNGEGEILWEKTIDKNTMYLIDGVPFYLDYLSQNVILNKQNIIRRIHASIITEISIKLEGVLHLVGLDPIIISDETLDSYGDNKYIEYLLEQELNRQFINSKQLILKNLLKYIRKKGLKTDSFVIEFFGTNSFNLVWEDVCKTIYIDDLNKKLNELSLISNGDIIRKDFKRKVQYKQDAKLKEIIEPPKWVLLETGSEYKTSRTLELDVLHVNKKDKTFEIFDAKYYMIDFTEKKIRNQPGIEDITKQYMYQIAFSDLAEINGYKFKNTFVIPKDELKEDLGDGMNYSSVSLGMMENLGLVPINVVARDPQLVFSEYLIKF